MKQEIIFDFDGVVHDTFHFHLGRVRRFFGIELSEQDFRDMHNGNFYESVPKALINADWEAYRDHIAPEFVTLEMSDRIKDVIGSLSKQHRLHVVSAGETGIISEYLEHNGMRGCFADILGGDVHRLKVFKIRYLRGQYGIGQGMLFFVTDTVGDILEVRGEDVRTVAIDTGYHDRTTLEKGNPHHIISHLSELKAILS